MILNSQSLFEFVPIRVPSWLLSQPSERPNLPILPRFPLVLLCSLTLRAFASSWLQVNYAKQTQFPKTQNRRKLFCHKELRTKTAPAPLEKTNPNKPNSSRRSLWRSWNLSRRSPPVAGRSRIPRNPRYSIRCNHPLSLPLAPFILYNCSVVPEGPICRFAACESRIERPDTKYEIREYDCYGLPEVHKPRLRDRA